MLLAWVTKWKYLMLAQFPSREKNIANEHTQIHSQKILQIKDIPIQTKKQRKIFKIRDTDTLTKHDANINTNNGQEEKRHKLNGNEIQSNGNSKRKHTFETKTITMDESNIII